MSRSRCPWEEVATVTDWFVPQSHSHTVPQCHSATVPQCHSATVPQSHSPTVHCVCCILWANVFCSSFTEMKYTFIHMFTITLWLNRKIWATVYFLTSWIWPWSKCNPFLTSFSNPWLKDYCLSRKLQQIIRDEENEKVLSQWNITFSFSSYIIIWCSLWDRR